MSLLEAYCNLVCDFCAARGMESTCCFDSPAWMFSRQCRAWHLALEPLGLADMWVVGTCLGAQVENRVDSQRRFEKVVACDVRSPSSRGDDFGQTVLPSRLGLFSLTISLYLSLVSTTWMHLCTIRGVYRVQQSPKGVPGQLASAHS